MNGRVLQGILLVVAVGCADNALDRPATARVDTLATGRIEVTNTGAPAWTPETAWQLDEDLRLGTVEGGGPEQFADIKAVISDSRGMIYVLDGGSQEVRVFDATGAFSHTIGSKGPGPGELSAAEGMSFGRGDTLWVLDGGGRYSAFAPDGTFLESHPRRLRGYVASAGTALSGGSYIDWIPATPDVRPGVGAVYWPMRFSPGFRPIRFSPGFGRLDSLPPLERTQEMVPSGRAAQVYFSGELSFAVDRGGSVWFAHTSEYRVFRRTLEGDTTLAFTHPAEAAPVGEAEREYVRSEWAERPSLLAEFLDALPETRPVVHRILPDDAGHIFVLADVAGAPPGTVVDVFRESGGYLGRMTLPTPVPLDGRMPPVVHASPEHLFVVIEDELGVPYVSRLKITRGR